MIMEKSKRYVANQLPHVSKLYGIKNFVYQPDINGNHTKWVWVTYSINSGKSENLCCI